MVTRVDIHADKGTEEVLDAAFYALCGGVWIEDDAIGECGSPATRRTLTGSAPTWLARACRSGCLPRQRRRKRITPPSCGAILRP